MSQQRRKYALVNGNTIYTALSNKSFAKLFEDQTPMSFKYIPRIEVKRLLSGEIPMSVIDLEK